MIFSRQLETTFRKQESVMNIKKIFFPFALLLIIFGCTKPAESNDVPGSVHSEEEEYIEPVNSMAQGVFVIDGSLTELKDDGKMHWKISLNAGETVDWTGELMEAVRAYDGATRKFYKVYFNGEELWAHDYYIYGPAVPAVIVSEETVLYTKPDLGSVAKSGIVTLPKYTIVAMVHDEKPVGDFMMVAAFLSLGVPGERWIKSNDISWDVNDVAVIKYARSAAATKVPASRKELFKNAMETASNGRRLNGLPLRFNFDPGLFELEITNNLQEISAGEEYIVGDEAINKRDMPSLNSNIVGQFKPGDVITVTARSKNSVKLEVEDEEINGVWLRTIEGDWVFSYYVIPYAP